MLDEVDKIGQDFRGDPASVLLEVLDPEQNQAFVDHYLEVPFDLSACMFIATANVVERLPGPLLDRLEVLTYQSYTELEKREIARRFFLPRQLAACGLAPEGLTVTDQALETIIRDYTREAGLRNLEREIARLARRLARLTLSGEPAPCRPSSPPRPCPPSSARPVMREGQQEKSRVGVMTGLVWSETGGEIVLVETTRMPGAGHLILTGSLGEVLRESAQTALSYVRSHARAPRPARGLLRRLGHPRAHPGRAVPKDGPSAGSTIALALISLLTGRPARADTAMSGEMSLSAASCPSAASAKKSWPQPAPASARSSCRAGTSVTWPSSPPTPAPGCRSCWPTT
jgi:ATP-dependent Lon protease